jgi:hypothetical protein
MTFNEARQELAAMVGASTCRALYYTLTEHGDGAVSQECRVYADGMVNKAARPSWVEALSDFRRANNPSEPVEVDGAPTTDIEESSGTTPETARPTGTAGGGVAPSAEQV